jgi:hypothetical protein
MPNIAPPWTRIPQDVLIALGKLTVSYGALDLTLHQCIQALAGTTIQISQILTSGLTFTALTDRYASLYRHKYRNAEDVAVLEAALKLVQDSTEHRNALIHSFWTGDPDTGVLRIRVTARAKQGWRRQLTKVAAADVETVIRELDLAQDSVAETIYRHQPSLRPSRPAP